MKAEARLRSRIPSCSVALLVYNELIQRRVRRRAPRRDALKLRPRKRASAFTERKQLLYGGFKNGEKLLRPIPGDPTMRRRQSSLPP